MSLQKNFIKFLFFIYFLIHKYDFLLILKGTFPENFEINSLKNVGGDGFLMKFSYKLS